MKKNIIALFALLVSLTAGAQALKVKSAPTRQLQRRTVSLQQAPRRAASQMHIGVIGDNDELFALNIGAGSFRTATLITSDLVGKYAGAKVVGCRFAVGADDLTGVRVWLSEDPSDPGQADLCTATPTELTVGWNEVMFATPYVLTGEEEELYLGYDFTAASAEQRSALLGSKKSDFGFLLCEGGRWYDYSSYGSLAVQLIVEGDNLPDYDVALTDFSTDSHYYAYDAEQMRFYLVVRNKGTKSLNGLVLNISIDGRADLGGRLTMEDVVEASLSLPQALPLKDYQLQPGRHTISIAVESLLDGTKMSEGTEEDDQVESFFYIYQNASQRQGSLLEVYVNQASFNDPMQASAIEQLMQLRTDVIPVFIHGDYYGDEVEADKMALPEANAFADMFGLYATPSIVFNRAVLPRATEMLQGISMQTIQPGYISEILNYTNEVYPAFATLSIEGSRDAEAGLLSLTVSGIRGGDFASIFGTGALTVYLTEDGIVAEQGDGEEVVADYVHNHVLRRIVSDPLGDELEWSGLRATKTYTVEIDPAWNLDKMHAVAFIAKPITETSTLDDVDVTNAASADVADFEDAKIHNAVRSIAAADASETQTFDLSGRQVTTDRPQRGIYVRNGHKVVVR